MRSSFTVLLYAPKKNEPILVMYHITVNSKIAQFSYKRTWMQNRRT
ncbi:hypothetical protein [Coprobacter sp.]